MSARTPGVFGAYTLHAETEAAGGGTFVVCYAGAFRHWPAAGFAVSTHKDRERKIARGHFTPADIREYVADNMDLFAGGEAFGTWVDGGLVVLDVVSVVPTKAHALELAHACEQDAIFDMNTGTVINCDGRH